MTLPGSTHSHGSRIASATWQWCGERSRWHHCNVRWLDRLTVGRVWLRTPLHSATGRSQRRCRACDERCAALPVVRTAIPGTAKRGRAQRFCRPSCRRAFHASVRSWALDAIADGTMTIAEIRNGAPATRTLRRGRSRLGQLPPQGRPRTRSLARWRCFSLKWRAWQN
jgi:hypothetical protein